MKALKQYYSIPVILAIAVAILLSYLLFPKGWIIKSVLIVCVSLIIMGVGFRIITYRRIRTIRNQLYQILQTLEAFDVDEPKRVAFESSPFPIFNELKEYLVELINRIRSNYHANKQFTQNASHELQTPLAIIKGHIELLLQSPNLGEKEVKSLAVLLQNTNRLSKLNSALILLSKIENHRFADNEVVDFEVVCEEVLDNFGDLITIQNLTIHKQYTTAFKVEMSDTLAEILIANLIQNAIRYNVPNGSISIEISTNQFSISNPGKTLNVTTDEMFKRFKRVSDVEESLGLGLSIVKRICEQYKLKIDYQNQENLHSITIQPLNPENV